MNIYLVWHYNYEQSYVEAAFSSKEIAEQYKKLLETDDDKNYGVEECELDPVATP